VHDIDFLCFGINRKFEQAGCDKQVTVTVLLTHADCTQKLFYTPVHTIC